jgi:hypothetical protein
MATVLQQQTAGQAAAKLLPGGGGDDGGDQRPNNDKPGRAHYVTDEMVKAWRVIFNKQAGSAGVKSMHGRCPRCGEAVGE